jgi:hypothetical protein
MDMSRPFKALAIAAAVTMIGAATVAGAANRGFSFSTRLTGYEETPSAVSTTGNGSFKGMISADGSSISWELSYADLEGAVQQAHLHFGQSAVTGPITVFMCTNLGNGPAGTQACPAPPTTITGTWTAEDVTNLANERGISAGEWAEFVNAIRAGVIYANVHSTRWPGGEIRGQLRNTSGSNGN